MLTQERHSVPTYLGKHPVTLFHQVHSTIETISSSVPCIGSFVPAEVKQQCHLCASEAGNYSRPSDQVCSLTLDLVSFCIHVSGVRYYYYSLALRPLQGSCLPYDVGPFRFIFCYEPPLFISIVLLSACTSSSSHLSVGLPVLLLPLSFPSNSSVLDPLQLGVPAKQCSYF
jgi:hypothetical protein